MANQLGLTSLDAQRTTGRRSSKLIGTEGSPQRSSVNSQSFAGKNQRPSSVNQNSMRLSKSSGSGDEGKKPPPPPPIRGLSSPVIAEHGDAHENSRTPPSLDRIAEGDCDEEQDERLSRVIEAKRVVEKTKQAQNGSTDEDGPSKERLVALLKDFVEITGSLLKENKVR